MKISKQILLVLFLALFAVTANGKPKQYCAVGVIELQDPIASVAESAGRRQQELEAIENKKIKGVLVQIFDFDNQEVPTKTLNFDKGFHSVDVVFSPDGKYLVCALEGEKPKIEIYWTSIRDDGAWKNLKTFDVDAKKIVSVAFSPDGRLLAYSLFDDVSKKRVVYILDTSKWGKKKTLQVAKGKERFGEIAFGKDYFAAIVRWEDNGKTNNKINIWDRNSWKKIRALDFDENIKKIIFHPTKEEIVVLLPDKVVLRDYRKKWKEKTYKTKLGKNEECESIVFSPDGKLVALGIKRQKKQHRIEMLNAKTWKLIQNFTTNYVPSVLTFSAESKFLASLSRPQFFVLAYWKGLMENFPWRLSGFLGDLGTYYSSIAFSPKIKSVKKKIKKQQGMEEITKI